MIEIKISGRGGQGVVLASQILAMAFFKCGRWVQAFPSFGAERRGAPVSAFVRANREEMTLRCGIYHPAWIILFDPYLFESSVALSGIREKGSLLMNGKERPKGMKIPQGVHFFVVDAIAIAHGLGLGSATSPIVNTAMAGAFAGASNLITIESVVESIRETVPAQREKNEMAAREAYNLVKAIVL